MMGMGFIRFSKTVSDAASRKPGRPAGPHPELQKSGRISLRSGNIEYESIEFWSVPVAEIKVIGEYSAGDGQIGADWFLVVISQLDSRPYMASMHAEGMRDVREKLESALNHSGWEVKPSQIRSSRVIWPSSLRDQPIFEFHENTSLFYKFLPKVFRRETEFSYSTVVQKYLT